MDDATIGRGLVESRGVMLIDAVSQATGLDRHAADALVTDRKVEGLYYADGRVFGIFDDALPTREQMQSWGLNVRDDYDPECHRSYTGDADHAADATETGSAGWIMTWDEDKSCRAGITDPAPLLSGSATPDLPRAAIAKD